MGNYPILFVSLGEESGEPFDEWIIADSPRNAAVHRSLKSGEFYCWECSSHCCEHVHAAREADDE